ncbi:MAG TPA: hypothetical protein V6D20_19840, partial [Candidatus Obscuribacterales bacterium]
VTVAAAIGWDGKLLARPEIHIRGVVSTAEPSRLEDLARDTIQSLLSDRWSNFTHTFEANETDVDWTKLQAQIEVELRRLLRREMRSNPMLVFLMQTPVEEDAKPKAKRTAAKKPEPEIKTEAKAEAKTPAQQPIKTSTPSRRQRSTAKVAS